MFTRKSVSGLSWEQHHVALVTRSKVYSYGSTKSRSVLLGRNTVNLPFLIFIFSLVELTC